MSSVYVQSGWWVSQSRFVTNSGGEWRGGTDRRWMPFDVLMAMALDVVRKIGSLGNIQW